MAKHFTLGKNERLKSRKLIEQLFKEGRRFSVSPFRISYLQGESANGSLQFGVGVSTRIFKKAVDRNRIKRLTREAYRLQKMVLQEKIKSKNIQFSIFFIYTAKELPEYEEVYKKVAVILKKADTIVDELK